MLCTIYRSTKKEGAYLYILKKDDFTSVPEALMQHFGKPVLVMMIELQRHKLARVEVEKVQDALTDKGYFLQLPPPPINLLDEYKKQKRFTQNKENN